MQTAKENAFVTRELMRPRRKIVDCHMLEPLFLLDPSLQIFILDARELHPLRPYLVEGYSRRVRAQPPQYRPLGKFKIIVPISGIATLLICIDRLQEGILTRCFERSAMLSTWTILRSAAD